MADSLIRQKSYAFSIRIVNMYKYLTETKREFTLSKQVLRSGTAIGASICEAEYAESDADYIHKFKISLKEASETRYWISLLKDTHYIDQQMFDSILPDCEELLRMLTAAIVTLRNKKK